MHIGSGMCNVTDRHVSVGAVLNCETAFKIDDHTFYPYFDFDGIEYPSLMEFNASEEGEFGIIHVGNNFL